MTEKFESQEYRDDLAGKLKEIRNSDPENVEKVHLKAEGYLEAQQETDEYKEADRHHRLVEYYKQLIEGPFDIHTCQKMEALYYPDYFDKLDKQLKKEEKEELQGLLDRVNGCGLEIKRYSNGWYLDFRGLEELAQYLNKEFSGVKEETFQAINIPKYKKYLAEYFKVDLNRISKIFSSRNLFLGVGSAPSIIFDPYYIHCEECRTTPMLDKLDSIFRDYRYNGFERYLIDKFYRIYMRNNFKQFYSEHEKEYMLFLKGESLEDIRRAAEKKEKEDAADLEKFDPVI